jgi:hypothetical protein
MTVAQDDFPSTQRIGFPLLFNRKRGGVRINSRNSRLFDYYYLPGIIDIIVMLGPRT